MTRRNLKWFIRGVTYDSPPAVALRDLRKGDCAILLPGCTKSDPIALHFGDRPMYLPYLPDDPTNAAFRLQQLELLCPVPASSRRRSPLFCSADTFRSLTHAQADDTLNALVTLVLGPAVAMALSRHSGRVWRASALLALHSDDDTIQVMVRWLCPESIRTYAHMEPAEYERLLLSAISAPITSRLSRNLPTIDAGDCIAHLSDAVAGFSDCSPARQPLARLPVRAEVTPPCSRYPAARLSASSTLMTKTTVARLTVRWGRLGSATLVLPSAEKTLLRAARSPFPSVSMAQRFTTPVASCAQRRAPLPPPRNGTCPSLTATYTSFATTVSSPFSNWAPTALPQLPLAHSEHPSISRLAPLSLSAGFPATAPRAAPALRHSPPPEL